MKQRLLRFFLPLIVVLTTILPVFPTTASATTSKDNSDAKTYCKSVKDPHSNLLTADLQIDCASGYLHVRAIIEAKGKPTGSQESSFCNSSQFQGSLEGPTACTLGWEGAANGSSSPTVPTLDTQTICSPFGGSKVAQCVQALQAQCAGWASSSNAKQNLTACAYGSLQKMNGGSNDCSSKYKKGAGLEACTGGFTTSQAPTPASSTTDTNTSSAPGCDASGFSLSWILCPIINGLASAADGIYSNIVQPLLQTAPINLSDPSKDPTHTYEIWSNFRIYGDIFLVIALLVIVFGESIGGGLIDAYSAKKILPRLLIAAILINLSIYLVALAVDLTNILGNSIGALIEAPFKTAACSAAHSLGNGGNCFALKINGSTGDLGMAALVGGGIWAAVSLGPLLEFLLLFFLIPAFLTMLAIMVTVLLRRGLIIALILVAPVAFALYCLPNTEKYFRQWWDLLLRTLLVYPLIAIMFAMANVLSVTIDTTSGGVTKTFADFLAIAALFVPLFLIPYSFRIAGGLLGRFHDLATQSRKQAHESIKGNANDPSSWRNRARSKLAMRNEEHGLSGKALATNFIPPTNPFRKSGRQEWRQNREAWRAAARGKRGQQFFESDTVGSQNKANDQFLAAIADPKLAKHNRDGVAKKLAAAKTPEKRAQYAGELSSWDQAFASERITHASPGVRTAAGHALAASGYQYAYGQEGYNQLAETWGGITGAKLKRDTDGNVIGAEGPNAGTWADNMDTAQYSLRNAGRFDLAGINRGTGYDLNTGVGKSTGFTLGSNAKPPTYKAGAAGYMGRGGIVLNNLPTRDEEDRENGPGSYDSKLNGAGVQLAQDVVSGAVSATQVSEWHDKLLDARQSATGANREEIDKQISSIRMATQHLQQNAPTDNDESFNRADAFTRRIENNYNSRRQNIDPNNIPSP